MALRSDGKDARTVALVDCANNAISGLTADVGDLGVEISESRVKIGKGPAEEGSDAIVGESTEPGGRSASLRASPSCPGAAAGHDVEVVMAVEARLEEGPTIARAS